MLRFVREFEGLTDKDLVPISVTQLNAELELFNKEIIVFHILFVESILVFALTAMHRPEADQRLKIRNAKLMEAQLLRVRQSAHSMDREA